MPFRRSTSYPSFSTSRISRTRSLPPIRPDGKQWFANTQPSGSAAGGQYQQFLQSLPPGFARYQTEGHKYLTPGSAQSFSRREPMRTPLRSTRREPAETPLILETRALPSRRHTPSQIPRQAGQSNLRSRARAVPPLPPRNPVTPPASFGRPPPPPVPPRNISPPIPPRSSILSQPYVPSRQLSPPIPPRSAQTLPRTFDVTPSRQPYPVIPERQSPPPPPVDEAMFREMASKINKENRNLRPDIQSVATNRLTYGGKPLSDLLTDKSRKYSYKTILERGNRRSSMEQTMDNLGYYERRGRYYRPSDDIFETGTTTRRLQPQPGFAERRMRSDDNVSRTSRTSRSSFSRLPTHPDEKKYLAPLLSRYKSTSSQGHNQLLSEQDQSMSKYLLSNRRSLVSRNRNDRRRMSMRTSKLPQTQKSVLPIDRILELDEEQADIESEPEIETYTEDENQGLIDSSLLTPTEFGGGSGAKAEKYTDPRLERLRNLFLEREKEIKKKKWYKFWK